MDDLMKLDGKELTPEQWHDLRHNKETKTISMLGQESENDKSKVKHSVIFYDKSQIFVFV